MIISLDKSINFECDLLEVIEKISKKKKRSLSIHSVKTDTICSRLKELSAGQSNGGAGQQSKEIVGSYTEASTSIVASSLADKDNHNNKQLWSKRAAEASDTKHKWACKDVLETIEAIPYH